MAPLKCGRRRSESGAELIEFALVLPIFLLILTGIVDFGLLLHRDQVLTNAAREGARLGVLASYTPADVEARVAAYLSASGLDAGEADTSVEVIAVPSAGGGPGFTALEVTVTYPHAFLFLGPIMGLFDDSIAGATLTAVSTMRTEVQLGG